MGRIERRFAALKAAGRTGLIPFVTAGDPSPDDVVARPRSVVDQRRHQLLGGFAAVERPPFPAYEVVFPGGAGLWIFAKQGAKQAMPINAGRDGLPGSFTFLAASNITSTFSSAGGICTNSTCKVSSPRLHANT